MKLVELKVEEFLDEVNSKSPAPGGGSVSALSSSLGISLLRMVGHLTIPKKKFLKLDEDIQEEFTEIFESLDFYLVKLKELIDKDTDAFNQIMKAFKLPKETLKEKDIRKAKIEEATIFAIEVPLEVAKLSLDVLKNTKIIIEHGNKNAISDIGVSVLTLLTGIEGAILNVKINLSGLNNKELKGDYEYVVANMMNDAEKLKRDLMEKIYSSL